ncbi:LysR family transcriptional regulator [Salinicola acroporae]|uniref:LysR family transcriptional regulator n=1 Tax=Salinicola acroporae TaxID=1541440 RepID=A0ABT6I1I0_9GAMM|nr:LysR family transcriptional regulator [Salinicola acroporae]MDH4571289.1 LysR family transcriptional regulator [Salinicola acroporae]
MPADDRPSRHAGGHRADRIDRLRAFVTVAELGSFTRAAHKLEWPRASISLAIQRLEKAIGTRLLNRSTRQVHLTHDGERLLDRARHLIEENERLERMFLPPHLELSGRLTVDVPSRVGRRLLTPALPGWLAQHANLQLELRATDRPVDLIAEGIDCAVRFGPLQDSALVVQRLGQVNIVNCASREYLARHGVPHTLDQLLTQAHRLVGYAASETGTSDASTFDYHSEGASQHLELPCQVRVNSAENYIACCEAGLGIIQVPRYDVLDQLRDGTLVELLPTFTAEPLDVSILYPHRQNRSPRVDAFVAWFRELMCPHLEPNDGDTAHQRRSPAGTHIAPMGFSMVRNETGSVFGMFVRADHEGRGVGRLLLERADRIYSLN